MNNSCLPVNVQFSTSSNFQYPHCNCFNQKSKHVLSTIQQNYEDEDLTPDTLMSKGELDEEERKRKNKVRALRLDCKLTYDEWITNAVEQAEALRKEDDLLNWNNGSVTSTATAAQKYVAPMEQGSIVVQTVLVVFVVLIHTCIL